MGDRCSMSINFGGQLKRELVEEFIEAIDADGFSSHQLGSFIGKPVDKVMEDIISNGVFGDDINYAQFDQIKAFCMDQKIQYWAWNGTGGDYGEGLERYDGEDARSAACSDGEPMIAMFELLKIESLAQGLADVLEIAKWWRVTELPPLEIVDGSCWGFYGADHGDSGLEEAAISNADCYLASANQEMSLV